MNIIDIDRRLELPPSYHGAGSLDAGFQLGTRDVPVVATEQVFIADAVIFDFAVGRWMAVSGTFEFGCCESGGGEEKEEQSAEFSEGWHGCGVVVSGIDRWQGHEGWYIGRKEIIFLSIENQELKRELATFSC